MRAAGVSRRLATNPVRFARTRELTRVGTRPATSYWMCIGCPKAQGAAGYSTALGYYNGPVGGADPLSRPTMVSEAKRLKLLTESVENMFHPRLIVLYIACGRVRIPSRLAAELPIEADFLPICMDSGNCWPRPGNSANLPSRKSRASASQDEIPNYSQ